MNRTASFRALALTILTVPAVALMAVPAYGQASDAPPGNNGTIKIDDVAMDEGNENNPHPGCTFVVDFFGYDVGTRTATLEFVGQAPTGGGELLVDTFTFDVASRESGNQLNASRTVDLTSALAGIEPHPQQGWHVKLTVHVDGSQGSDVKHKVFWVSECAVAPAEVEDEVVPEAPAEVTPIAAPDSDVLGVNEVATAAPAPAPAAPAPTPASSSEGEVLGATLTASAPGADTLPRTGYGTSWSLAAAALSLAAGFALVSISRRRLAA